MDFINTLVCATAAPAPVDEGWYVVDARAPVVARPGGDPTGVFLAARERVFVVESEVAGAGAYARLFRGGWVDASGLRAAPAPGSSSSAKGRPNAEAFATDLDDEVSPDMAPCGPVQRVRWRSRRCLHRVAGCARLRRARGRRGHTMATALKEMMGKQISVITCDGRNIVGQLRGYDQVRATRRTARGTPGATAARAPQVTNVILDECHERVFSLDAGVEQVVLGLYIIRGAPRRARIRRRRTPPPIAGPRRRRAGDNIAVIGEVDIELDAQTDFSELRADALKPVTHT
ncbi:hypothetical protein JL720_12757 [Aureococcus anophagefferens]|nr:hypothetical protein JL720_12757 [Aureococcus anophagefferens]